MQQLSSFFLCRINGEIHLFTPYFLEFQKFYTTMDNDLIVEMFKDELQFVRSNWNLPGRPTMTVMLTNAMFYSANMKHLLNLMVSLKSGICNRVRVRVGRIKELIHTSCIDEMDFLSHKVPFMEMSYFANADISYLKREGEQIIKSSRYSTRGLFG